MRAPRWERRSLLVPGGAVGQMVKGLNRNPDEVRLLIRRKDMLPVYAVGDMEALLGIRLEDLQGGRGDAAAPTGRSRRGPHPLEKLCGVGRRTGADR